MSVISDYIDVTDSVITMLKAGSTASPRIIITLYLADPTTMEAVSVIAFGTSNDPRKTWFLESAPRSLAMVDLSLPLVAAAQLDVSRQLLIQAGS